MLATAAVIGRFFGFEILQAAIGADVDSILERVEEAEKAGLVFSGRGKSQGPVCVLSRADSAGGDRRVVGARGARGFISK